MSVKPHLYINSKGYYVTRHSYSGSESFHFCARKYYLQRVQGWNEREQRSSAVFGTALEKAITFWHQRGFDVEAAVAEFIRQWTETAKDKDLVYSKSDLDWDRLNLSGQELIRLYAIKYPSFPYVVKNPLRNFQVETNFEVFPGSKLAGIEFTSYIDLVAELKENGNPLIIDMKTSGKDVPELTILDPQLRSYSWVKGWPDVAFLWFRKMGRTISRGDRATLLRDARSMTSGTEVFVLAKDDFGIWVTLEKKIIEDMGALFVGESKEVRAARQAYIETNGTLVNENAITKQRVQFKHAIITPESAEDIGRSIKKDIIDIASATEKDFFPMQSGIRYPNEKCPNCAMRGICSNNSDLRDMLLVRRQMDEFDFSVDSE